MFEYTQGDIIRLDRYKNNFLIVSRSSFIKTLDFFYVCPILTDCAEGPTHIKTSSAGGSVGIVVCELIKMIDPAEHSCKVVDRLIKYDMMIVSDVIHGIMEYS